MDQQNAHRAEHLKDSPGDAPPLRSSRWGGKMACSSHRAEKSQHRERNAWGQLHNADCPREGQTQRRPGSSNPPCHQRTSQGAGDRKNQRYGSQSFQTPREISVSPKNAGVLENQKCGGRRTRPCQKSASMPPYHRNAGRQIQRERTARKLIEIAPFCARQAFEPPSGPDL